MTAFGLDPIGGCLQDDILSSLVCRLLEPFSRLTLTAMTLFTAWILSADASRMTKKSRNKSGMTFSRL